MKATYDYNVSQTLNDKVNIDRLETEIQKSTIIIALDYISVNNLIISINFKDELSDSDENTLNIIVSNHTGEVINYLVPQKVKIVEESTPDGENLTQGHYQARSYMIDVPAVVGEYYVEDSFPYYISIASAQWFCNEENLGDEASFVLGHDTIVGALLSGTTSGDTEFYVSDTVIGAMDLGFCIKIGDEELGDVWVIDKVNKKITSEFGTSLTHNPGTLVRMCVAVVKIFHFTGVGLMQIGDAKIGTSLIPPNMKMRMIYKNNNGLSKKISFCMDYSY